MNKELFETAEQKRLEENKKKSIPLELWGPYLSERQWGTVREDYSAMHGIIFRMTMPGQGRIVGVRMVSAVFLITLKIFVSPLHSGIIRIQY